MKLVDIQALLIWLSATIQHSNSLIFLINYRIRTLHIFQWWNSNVFSKEKRKTLYTFSIPQKSFTFNEIVFSVHFIIILPINQSVDKRGYSCSSKIEIEKKECWPNKRENSNRISQRKCLHKVWRLTLRQMIFYHVFFVFSLRHDFHFILTVAKLNFFAKSERTHTRGVIVKIFNNNCFG